MTDPARRDTGRTVPVARTPQVYVGWRGPSGQRYLLLRASPATLAVIPQTLKLENAVKCIILLPTCLFLLFPQLPPHLSLLALILHIHSTLPTQGTSSYSAQKLASSDLLCRANHNPRPKPPAWPPFPKVTSSLRKAVEMWLPCLVLTPALLPFPVLFSMVSWTNSWIFLSSPFVNIISRVPLKLCKQSPVFHLQIIFLLSFNMQMVLLSPCLSQHSPPVVPISVYLLSNRLLSFTHSLEFLASHIISWYFSHRNDWGILTVLEACAYFA